MTTTLKHNLALAAMGVVRMVLALTYLFSGVVKLIDPRGTQYKIEDYGAAFGLSSVMPESLPLVLACILGIIEFLMGIYLFFGIRRRLASTVSICFLLVMTPLTLYLALKNPVSDCGCFGDALVLTNWQTFAKNVVLLVFSIIALRFYKLMPHFVVKKLQWVVALCALVFAALFVSYNLWRLPVIDFRPYHVGADIRQAWYDDQQGFGQFVTTFIMEKDGVQKEFALEDYPDSTWTLIDTKTTQIEPPKRTGVGDLLIQDVETGEDITLQILEDQAWTLLLIAPYLEKADDGVMGELLALYDFCKETGCRFYCLTSSGEEAIANWTEMTGAEYPFCHADAVVLKTMIRSNPGLMLLHDGKVMRKWPSTDLPTPTDILIIIS
ncbi:MAG: DoxX family protein [Bacteroidaceae bacterium]|nr:DoxX family protein [Bacteroidaceae bacterium]